MSRYNIKQNGYNFNFLKEIWLLSIEVSTGIKKYNVHCLLYNMHHRFPCAINLLQFAL